MPTDNNKLIQGVVRDIQLNKEAQQQKEGITIDLSEKDGYLVLKFNRAITEIHFTKTHAKDLAHRLIKRAIG